LGQEPITCFHPLLRYAFLSFAALITFPVCAAATENSISGNNQPELRTVAKKNKVVIQDTRISDMILACEIKISNLVAATGYSAYFARYSTADLRQFSANAAHFPTTFSGFPSTMIDREDFEPVARQIAAVRGGAPITFVVETAWQVLFNVKQVAAEYRCATKGNEVGDPKQEGVVFFVK
jgi:hypothetical protein